MNPLFRPKTIKTILESAPVVIQGAGKLIQVIREKDRGNQELEHPNEEGPDRQRDDVPLTLEGLRSEINRLDKRLVENAESDVEQIKLIEQLARQNEAMAESITKNHNRLAILAVISALAIGLALFGILLSLR